MQPQRPATRKAPARAAEPRPRGTPASSAPDPEVAAVRRLLPDAGGGLPLVLLGVLGFVAGAIFEQATSGQPAARADDPGAPAIPNIPVVAPPPLAQPAVAPPGSPIVPPTPPVAPAITAPAGTPPAATEVTPAPVPATAPALPPVAAPAAGTPSAPAATTLPAAGAEAAPAPADGIQFLDSPRKVGRRDEAPKSPVGSDFARLLLVLVLIGAGLLAWYFVRRRNQGLNLAGGRDQLQVLGTTHVGGRWLVALVRVPGRTLVVGASDKGLSLLSEIRDEGDDQLPALPDGLTRDAQGLLGAAPESARGLADARGRAGAPFDNLLSEMLRGGGGAAYGPSTGSAPPAGDPSTRGNSSPLESPEARALRARLQRQQPSP